MTQRPDPRPLAPTPAPDAALLALARGGDRDAFDCLAVRLLPRLMGTARRLLSDPLEAEEAVAAALVRVHAALPSFRGAAALSTWAHRILCRLAFDRLRVRARERAHRSPWPADEPAHASAGPLEAASEREQGLRVRIAVQGLPPTQRLVLVLVAWEGLSLADAAQVLGMRYATAKSNLHHARAGLRARLGLPGDLR